MGDKRASVKIAQHNYLTPNQKTWELDHLFNNQLHCRMIVEKTTAPTLPSVVEITTQYQK
jgi:hypothetical protein